jgi:predicted DNA-binding transcriptional regulator AlpA
MKTNVEEFPDQVLLNAEDCGYKSALEAAEGPGMLIHSLAALPGRSILDEAKLAHLLGVTTRTIRRMVGRFELPPPVSLGGKSVWMAGRVLDHIEAVADRRQQEADRQARKFRKVASAG